MNWTDQRLRRASVTANGRGEKWLFDRLLPSSLEVVSGMAAGSCLIWDRKTNLHEGSRNQKSLAFISSDRRDFSCGHPGRSSAFHSPRYQNGRQIEFLMWYILEVNIKDICWYILTDKFPITTNQRLRETAESNSCSIAMSAVVMNLPRFNTTVKRIEWKIKHLKKSLSAVLRSRAHDQDHDNDVGMPASPNSCGLFACLTSASATVCIVRVPQCYLVCLLPFHGMLLYMSKSLLHGMY